MQQGRQTAARRRIPGCHLPLPFCAVAAIVVSIVVALAVNTLCIKLSTKGIRAV